MKLLSYEINGTQSFGIATNNGIVDLSKVSPDTVNDLKSLLASEIGLNELQEIADSCDKFIDIKKVTLLPVIPNPGTILCLGMNTHSHCAEIKAATGLDTTPKIPQLFMRMARTQVAHGQALELPNGSPLLDYEGEIAIVIGKFGRHLKEENALNILRAIHATTTPVSVIFNFIPLSIRQERISLARQVLVHG